MSRIIKIGAAQSGPIQKAEDRESVVARLLELMKHLVKWFYTRVDPIKFIEVWDL